MSEVVTGNPAFSLIAKGKKPELVKAAYHFGVIDTPESSENVAVLRAKLEEEGINDTVFSGYLAELEAAKVAALAAEEAAKVEAEQKNASNQSGGTFDTPTVPVLVVPETPEERHLLVKMKRRNPSMTIRGYKFTTKSPYQVVPEKEAEFIISKYKGFSIALPSEAEAYYEPVK